MCIAIGWKRGRLWYGEPVIQAVYRPLLRKFKRLPPPVSVDEVAVVPVDADFGNLRKTPLVCLLGDADEAASHDFAISGGSRNPCVGSMVHKARDVDTIPFGNAPPSVVNWMDGPDPQEVLVDDVVYLPGGCEVDGIMVDLTEDFAPCRRHAMGRWSITASRCGGFVLSRVVSPEELDRNTTRIPAFGWCGYLSLECAERRSRGVGGGALDLRLSHGRTRMASFVGGLLRGCLDDAVCRKLQGLLSHLREASNAWRLDRGSGLWMDVSDVQHMCVAFPVVIWGQDPGSGLRRVMYPPRGNGVVSLAWAEEVMRTPPS